MFLSSPFALELGLCKSLALGLFSAQELATVPGSDPPFPYHTLVVNVGEDVATWLSSGGGYLKVCCMR